MYKNCRSFLLLGHGLWAPVGNEYELCRCDIKDHRGDEFEWARRNAGLV